MIAFNAADVNKSNRRTDVARDGFDRDITIEVNPRRLFAQTVSKGDVIDIWSDADTRPERAELASRGDTFAGQRNPNQSLAISQTTKNEESDSEESKVEFSETRRRYDLKHAVVRMLRTGLKEHERGPGVCGCGTAAYDKTEEDGQRLQVPVHRNDEQRAWVSGVLRCKSGWLCPTCAPAVARERQEDVQEVVQATTDANGVFLMGLVTVRHTKKDRLADVKNLVTNSFLAARRQKNWARAEEAAGVAGVLVAPEVTFGKHGWHYHIHFGFSCLPCDDGEMTDAASEYLEDAALAAGRVLIDNFRRQVAKRGGKTVDDGQGIQIAASGEAAADYIAKGTAWELAGGTAHKSEVKGQTIWEIVEDADAGDIDAFARFREYAEVMPGTRSCIITPKLRENLNLPAVVENDDGEQQFEDGGKIVGHLETYIWRRFMRTKLAGTFLSRIESINGDVTADVFDKLVTETTADADRQEGVITLTRAAKIQTSAADIAAGHASTRIMLARNIAYRVRGAQALGNVHEIIAARIEIFRNEGHPEAALPTPSDVVREIAGIGREASERAMAA